MRALLASVAALAAMLGLAAPALAADEPLPGDTRATAIVVRPGESAAILTASAHAEPGDEDGGHSVWFRVETPAGSTSIVDTRGTDFDAVVAWGGTVPASPWYAGGSTGLTRIATGVGRATISGRWFSYGEGHPTYFRLDGVEPEDVGTARLEVRDGAAPEDAWVSPVPLDLAGTAVATASRAGASPALEPGEPGGAGEQQSVWFSTVAPRAGRLALDVCGHPALSTSVSDGVLRVLDDRPLGEAAVLGQGRIGLHGADCAPVELDVTAGQRVRVQATYLPDYPHADDRSIVLRGRMEGTPPTVDVVSYPLACDGGRCTAAIRALPAPGAPLTAVECRLGRAPWSPCERDASGGLRTPSFSMDPTEAEQVVGVRATDAAGRRAIGREAYRFATPAIGEAQPVPITPPAPPAPAGGPTTTDPAPVALRAPTGRFVVSRRGTRVRSLAVRGGPAGTRVTVTCRGAGCPSGARARLVRTAARGGALDLRWSALRRATLRPGARLTVTVSAAGRAARRATWTVRAGRAPARVVR